MIDREFNEFGEWPHGGVRGGGKGFRAARGMMEPAILTALAERPMHGYDIISHLEEKSHGFWRPSPGSIYPTLQLLEEKELVIVDEKEGKRVYSLTATGKKAADEATAHRAKWKEDFAERLHDTKQARKLYGEIARQVRTIYHSGSDQQKAKLEQALLQLKQQLNSIERNEN